MNVNNKCRESKRKLFIFNNIKKKKYGCINSKKVEEKNVAAVKQTEKKIE